MSDVPTMATVTAAKLANSGGLHIRISRCILAKTAEDKVKIDPIDTHSAPVSRSPLSRQGGGTAEKRSV